MTISIECEWKNCRDLYNCYIQWEEAPKAMQLILSRYQWMFDEEYFYWVPNFQDGERKWIKRRPLYWWPQKSTPTEKRKPYIKGKQLKL